MNYYTIDEVKLLLNALDQLPENELHYKAAIYIGLFGGLRKGEILGLNWEDVDFEKGELRIQRSRMYAPGTGTYEDTPKTEKSNRSVAVPKEVMDLLFKLQLQQKYMKLSAGTNYKDSPAVIRSSTGNPLHPSVLYRWWASFIKKCDLRHIGLHALRHTHASMLVHLGEDKVQVSNRLGHSQISTTLNIYTHLFEESDRRLADNLSDAFL
jgi:integrase